MFINILWPLISPYFLCVFCAYLFSGVYYIVCDVSKEKADRPSYLANPKAVIKVGVFWSVFLIHNMWGIWHKRSRYNFYDYLKRKVVPQIAVFLVLIIDIFYAFRYLN
jgi:hypothetical protein